MQTQIDTNNLILPNGSRVLKIDFLAGVVLAEKLNSQWFSEYVTWRFDEKLNCIYGHYFHADRVENNDSVLVAAIADYTRRVDRS